MPKPESQIPDNHILPDSQLEKRTRRRFSTKYKLRILAEADQCAYGELGPLLRRENLYSNQLRDWRKQLEVGGEAALSSLRRGLKRQKHRTRSALSS
ncbi:MAG: transposase [Marinobacter sp.]|nr:transposase [Marinobacter sp.]